MKTTQNAKATADSPLPSVTCSAAGFWRSPRGENHGLNSKPGDVWVNPGDIHDTDRLEWCLKYCYAARLGGALDADDFVYEPIRTREQIDAQILNGKQQNS